MPGPPPYGESSTDRCTSWVHRRRSCTASVDDARVNRLARQRLSQRVEVVGEDRDDVNAHRPQLSSSRPSGGSISMVPVGQRHRRHDGADERHQHLAFLCAHGEAIRLPRCAIPRRRCRRPRPADGHAHAGPRAGGRRTRRDPRWAAGPRCRRRTGCPSARLRYCGLPRRRGAPAAGRRARVRTRRRSAVRARRWGLPRSSVPGAKRSVGIVGADVDDDLAGDAVRFDDPPDYQVHGTATGRCPPRRRGCRGRRCRRPTCAARSRCGRHGR